MQIKIKELVKRVSSRFVLNISDVELLKGEITALVGANGAGKTTLLKVLMGHLETDFESIVLRKNSIEIKSFQDLNSTSYIDSKSLIQFLTIKEYFELFKQINVAKGYKGLWNEEIVDLLLKEELSEKILIRELSMGTQVKVGIAVCFLRIYDLVILDEPFAHLDPPSQEIVCNIMINYIQRSEYKTIVLFSSHDLRNVAKLADNVIFLKEGKVSTKLQKNQINTQILESLFGSIR